MRVQPPANMDVEDFPPPPPESKVNHNSRNPTHTLICCNSHLPLTLHGRLCELCLTACSDEITFMGERVQNVIAYISDKEVGFVVGFR